MDSGSGTRGEAARCGRAGRAPARARYAAALETLMERHSSRVYRVAFGITRNHPEAEEVVQDVFLTLFRKIDMFEGRAALGTWLYRVAANAALIKRRGKRVEMEVSLEDCLPTFRDDGHREGDRAMLDRGLVTDSRERAAVGRGARDPRSGPRALARALPGAAGAAGRGGAVERRGGRDPRGVGVVGQVAPAPSAHGAPRDADAAARSRLRGLRRRMTTMTAEEQAASGHAESARPTGGGGGRTWPTGNGARCARTTRRTATPGPPSPTTTPARASTAGARTASSASRTIISVSASRSPSGTSGTPS